MPNENLINNLRDIILNTREPLVIRNFKQSWKCFEGSLEDWCKLFDDAPLSFDRMPMQYWNAPQWERQRLQSPMSCVDFLKECSTLKDNWIGLNYKKSQEMPPPSKEGVDFSCFGFPQATEDVSFWLCSKGSNTPCHYDTYGCNVVLQVYGRKSWLLFPPQTALSATRIPYEESSVYCTQNFYSPNSQEQLSLKQFKETAYRCVLEPNDLLIVPRHWWHYVESLDTSLSLNAWINLQCDVEAQIDECIVKFLMEKFVLGVDDDTKKYLLNPNQLTEIITDAKLFEILQFLLNERAAEPQAKRSMQKYSYQYMEQDKVLELLTRIPEATMVERLKSEEFIALLTNNAKRFNETLKDCNTSPLGNIKETLINSICSPSVIKAIKKTFYESLKKTT